MSALHTIGHSVKYGGWLLGQVLAAAWSVIADANRKRTQIDPVIVAYPLRVTTDREIGIFTTSITMTPGTLSLGLLEVGDPLPCDVSMTPGPHEPAPCDRSERGLLLLVHAVFGSDPVSLMADLADMERRISPNIVGETEPQRSDGYVTSLRYQGELTATEGDQQ